MRTFLDIIIIFLQNKSWTMCSFTREVYLET